MATGSVSVPPQRGLRQIWRLVKSDYYAGYAYKREDEQRMRMLMIPRILTNSSLHANLLVRLMVECRDGWPICGAAC